MSLIKAIIATIEIIIVYVFSIPAFFICGIVESIIIPIIIFLVMVYYSMKKEIPKGILDTLLMHTCFILTYFTAKMNPGTDDTFKDLDKVFNSMLLSSLFAMLSLIFLYKFLIKFKDHSESEKLDLKQFNIHNNKKCPVCGAINNPEDTTCHDCGITLTK